MFYSGAFFSLGMTTQMLATFPCVSMTRTFQVLQFPQPIHSFQKNIAASWGIKVAVCGKICRNAPTVAVVAFATTFF